MSTSPRTRLALAAALLVTVVAIVVAVLTLTGRDHDTSGGHPAGDADAGMLGPQPTGADPATAARAGLAAMFSWRPATDASTGAGLTRAQPWLTGQLLTESSAGPATGIRALPEWAGWRQAADIVTAVVKVDQVAAPDGGPCRTECRAQTVVTQIVQHTDGTATPWRVMSVAAALTDTPDGWRLASFRVTG